MSVGRRSILRFDVETIHASVWRTKIVGESGRIGS